jgi:hypothetical protein
MDHANQIPMQLSESTRFAIPQSKLIRGVRYDKKYACKQSLSNTRSLHFPRHQDQYGDYHESDCRINNVITKFWMEFLVNAERMRQKIERDKLPLVARPVCECKTEFVILLSILSMPPP